MKQYIVRVREIHESYRLVEAENEADALHDGAGGTEIHLEYVDTLPQSTWKVDSFDELMGTDTPTPPDDPDDIVSRVRVYEGR